MCKTSDCTHTCATYQSVPSHANSHEHHVKLKLIKDQSHLNSKAGMSSYKDHVNLNHKNGTTNCENRREKVGGVYKEQLIIS